MPQFAVETKIILTREEAENLIRDAVGAPKDAHIVFNIGSDLNSSYDGPGMPPQAVLSVEAIYQEKKALPVVR